MLEKIRNKHLLIDTNAIISLIRFSDFYIDFFNQLEKYNVKSIIDYAIKFEFLRGSQTKRDYETKEKYLDILLGENRSELICTNEIFENAREIANIYARKDSKLNKQISPTDCLVAAQMKKFNETIADRLFLATVDNHDFPLFVFDRISIFTIDTEKDIINMGIYGFNKRKYENLQKEFYN